MMDIRATIPKAKRGRGNAGANETTDIATIITAINTRSPAGLQIMSAFRHRYGEDITRARARTGSNRGTHYDFEVEVGGVWKRVEHKSEQVYRIPNPDDVPWKAGVQFYNGGCEKYSFTRKYAQVWYDIHIRSGDLSKEYDIQAPIPTFEDWFDKDCRAQSIPRTSFAIELKRKVRQMRGKRESLRDKREPVHDAMLMLITEEDKANLVAEVLPIANQVLQEKDYWLSIHGDLTGDFHAVWYPSFTIGAIREVRIIKELDLKFEFVCEDGVTFGGILRWGRGAGFSNLRLDLK